MPFLRNLFLIFLVLLFSIAVSFFINSSSLRQLNKPAIVITPENINSVVNDIESGDIVEINGTLDLFHLATDSNNSPENTNYFAGLTEFKNQLVVKFEYDKLNFQQQNFKGQVVFLDDEQIGGEIIDELNSPINFNDPLNSQLVSQFSESTKDEITKASEGNFDEASLLILDGILIDQNTIYTNIILIFVVVSLFLLTLFRKKIFKIKKKKIIVGQVVIETPNV